MNLREQFLQSQGADNVLSACESAAQRHFGGDLTVRGSTDLFGLARKKGISVEYAPDLPFEGAIERDSSGQAQVKLRRGMNRRRERFTLAHELGHWILQEEMLGTTEGRLFRGLSRNSLEMRDEEKLANLLAAELLLPRSAIAGRFPSTDVFRFIEQLCRSFVVSRTMAVRRVADIVNKNLLLLQLMPYQFSNKHSLVQIDDAVFATANEATLFDRAHTRLVGKISFEEMFGKNRIGLTIDSPKGVVSEEFEISHRPRPVPHVYALAMVKEWPSHGRAGR